MKRHGRPDAARGLSLIEVIVALVVISGFGAALFVWAGQTLQTASRASDLQRTTELERNVTEIAATLNPSLAASGELRTATHRYQWQSRIEAGPADQPRPLAGVTAWQVGLYRVTFTVTELGSEAPPIRSERLVTGYRQARDSQLGPPGFEAPTRRAP